MADFSFNEPCWPMLHKLLTCHRNYDKCVTSATQREGSDPAPFSRISSRSAHPLFVHTGWLFTKPMSRFRNGWNLYTS